MLSFAKKGLTALGIDPTKAYQALSAMSLRAAIRQHGYDPLCARLRAIIPDVRDQYTTDFDPGEYEAFWEVKMRGLHAFQIQCTLDALDAIGRDGLVVADLGDSSGNHSRYVRELARGGQVVRLISVNLDPVAVEKVKAKGGEAILSRVEDLDPTAIAPDLVMSFQMVEHLTDPVRFLHGLATKGTAEHVLLTLPYRRRSRFGGFHLRAPEDSMQKTMTAEEVHVYEFSPEDWALLARFAGFDVVFERRYLQYPSWSWLSWTRWLWEARDHEGFVGLLLKRELSVANRYTSW